jgi:hypothetical protein
MKHGEMQIESTRRAGRPRNTRKARVAARAAKVAPFVHRLMARDEYNCITPLAGITARTALTAMRSKIGTKGAPLKSLRSEK